MFEVSLFSLHTNALVKETGASCALGNSVYSVNAHRLGLKAMHSLRTENHTVKARWLPSIPS